jgi:hypothetical protein
MPVETTIQVRRDTAANWTSTNPTLAAGERGFETDTKLYKTGDGTTAWTSLGYDLGNLTLKNFTHQVSNGIDVLTRESGISTSGVGTISGSIAFTFFTPVETTTVSQVSMQSSAAGSGLTLVRIGLYTFDETTATLVAQTANDTTIFNANQTVFTRSFDTTGGFPATYRLVAGQRYALAVIQVGTTPASLIGKVTNSVLNAVAPKMNGSVTGQSDLVATRTTFTVGSARYWGRFS